MSRRGNLPPKDPRGPHQRLYAEVLDSHAWAVLSSSACLAYLVLMRHKGSTNNGDLSLPITVARRYGIKSETTLAKALRELCAVGLLAITRKGGSTKEGHRQVNLYRFTEYDVYENPSKQIEACKATHDWKAITTLGRGREAIRQAEQEAAAAEVERKKTRLQKMEPTTPEIGGVEPKTTPEIGGRPAKTLQKMKLAQGPPNAANPCPATI